MDCCVTFAGASGAHKKAKLDLNWGQMRQRSNLRSAYNLSNHSTIKIRTGIIKSNKRDSRLDNPRLLA